MKILLVKEDVMLKATKDPKMAEILDDVSWGGYEKWLGSCMPLLKASKTSQQTSRPNLHRVILDSLVILDELRKLVNLEDVDIRD